jgi:nucleotide-binding universal stress UspA family protein
MTSATGVPPIEVYQIGEAFFVKDGNHRVSVARQLGASRIEAHVTPVRTKVPLSPDTQLDDLISRAEYADFLELTRLDELRPEADLTVTIPGQYEELEQHIEVQHFLLCMEYEREISYEQAVIRWYDEFYLPVAQVIRQLGALRDFPERTETDLYVWTVKHRLALERELGWQIGHRSAAADLADRFSPKWRRVVRRVRKRILDTVTPHELEAGPAPGKWRKTRLTDDSVNRVFRDIMVAVDGEKTGWCAMEMALEVARRENARLQGLYVAPSEAQRKSEEAWTVQTEFERLCKAAGIVGKLALVVGKAPDLLVERARLTDLVVLGLSHRYAPQPVARLGSGLHSIVRRCPTPVLAVPGPGLRLNRALLAYDGSPKANEALFVATYLSGRWDIELFMMTVMESGRATQDTLTQAQDYLENHGVQATLIKGSGAIAEAILVAGKERGTDLIVMGGYGFSPIKELALGSTVGSILRSSSQSVLICR